MPYFKIYRDMGYVGTEDYDVVEVDNLIEAEDMAEQWALEMVSSWAEEITKEEYDQEV